MIRSKSADAIAGLLAAAVALAMAELAAGVTGGASLIVEVGDVIVDRTPGPVIKWAIGLLGTNDKPFLLGTVTVAALAIGALLGPLAGRVRMAGFVAFAIFGAIGALAGTRDPLTGSEIAILIAVVAAVSGAAALSILLEAAPSRRDVDAAPQMPGRGVADRRRFLQFAGAAGGGAALAAFVGRGVLGPAVDVESQREAVTLPPTNIDVGANGFEVDGLSPLITPNDQFYRIDTALVVPRVDTKDWKLSVTGMVDHPFELTFDELLELATLEEAVTLACVSNEVGDDLVGNAIWRGVPLASLLERAGVQAGATQIVGRSVDNFTTGFPTEIALDGRPAMVAIGMNGEPLPAAHGFPARLVVPGLYGYVSATKWLKEIELNTLEGYDAYWIPRGWAKLAPIKTQSRIDTPRSGKSVAAGPLPIAGVAWGGTRSVQRVEVRITSRGADTPSAEWLQAELGEALSQSTWRQWVLLWDAHPGEYDVEVRATDGDGETQTEERHAPAPDGATGYHRISLSVSEASSVAAPNDLADPQESLRAARARWAIAGGDDYDMEFNWICSCAPALLAPVELQVRGAALRSGVFMDGPDLPPDQLADYRTVEGLFEFIQEGLDAGASKVSAIYEENGTPKQANVEYVAGQAGEDRGFVLYEVKMVSAS
ncbi:MAG: molybdopterin-dependent oxidoreductase [Chloroflexi bacterium]|nr:molybdopterin-dependent oxidoreductase [Chloroflexota bacterium]MDA1145869.1 molybdopterin-dependent oxidoreductase [Chloroflexota bacterium]